MSFQDMSGAELAFIRQRLLWWGPTYEATVDGALIAEVKKELFTDTYGIEVVDPADTLVLTAAVVIDAVCHHEHSALNN